MRSQVDFCVVGGGLAGVCAAVAAARRGAKVALMQDRPVLGGNSSSEVRMWVCGAHGAGNRETGIIEELNLSNLHRNPTSCPSVWDSVVYEAARFEPGILLLLNCACTGADMDGRRILRVRGYQSTTQTWHTIEAPLFADCSGDSVLAPLTGAAVRVGREAAEEFSEDIEPARADRMTMGNSLLIQIREMDRPVPFIPPSWADVYATDESLPFRDHRPVGTNYWWIELGGDADTIRDTEEIRDQLLRAAFGVWDHVKNRGDHGAANWALEWVGFLPGKRESRRYVGDHTLTQNDIRNGGPFDDIVAYGGWSMDDHHPQGLRWQGPPTVFHPAPSPYGIPYRSLYSAHVPNLWCAGRNISATHAALSSTRVMATCAVLGQAVGTAAAIACRWTIDPREVGACHIDELQQTLIEDDCWLPGLRRTVPGITTAAALTASHGDPAPLINGVDRSTGANENAWTGPAGSWIELRWSSARRLAEARIVCDSDLDRDYRRGDRDARQNLRCAYGLCDPYLVSPPSLVRALRFDALGPDGVWRTVTRHAENHQRLVRLPLDIETRALRLIPESTHGADHVRLFAFDVTGA